MSNTVTLNLPSERPLSWNKAYAGQHWTQRKAEVERIRLAVREQIDPDAVEPFAVPVDVTITVFFASRPLDADNIPGKLYIDALKGWLLVDDDQQHVLSVRTVTALDKAAPRVVIRIASTAPEPAGYEATLASLGQCRCCVVPAGDPLTDGGAALVGIGEGCHA